jgi:hypothetical protein
MADFCKGGNKTPFFIKYVYLSLPEKVAIVKVSTAACSKIKFLWTITPCGWVILSRLFEGPSRRLLHVSKAVFMSLASARNLGINTQQIEIKRKIPNAPRRFAGISS